MPVNTTVAQDRVITLAKDEHDIADLISIIEELDTKITEWRDNTDCSNPDDARTKILSLQSDLNDAEIRISDMESQLKDAESEIGDLKADIDNREADSRGR